MVTTKPSKLVSSKITQFVDDYISKWGVNDLTMASDREKIKKLSNVLRRDPVLRFTVEVTYLYLLSIFGEYSHTSARITKDINASIAYVNGSWKEILKQMLTCFWYGYSWSEIAFDKTVFNRVVLAELVTLDPVSYDFTGKKGKIEFVQIFKNKKDLKIPYDKGIHLVTGVEISFNRVYGCGRLESIEPYIDLHNILMSVLAVASTRQATPILVKKTDTGRSVDIYDMETGEPVRDMVTGEIKTIPNGIDSVRQLAAIEESGVVAIDTEDDLYQIEPKLASDFLLAVAKYVEAQKIIGMVVPPLLFTTSLSGVGDSNLGSVHLNTFYMTIYSMAEFLGEQLVEQWVRPQIEYNFGVQSNYGSFQIQEFRQNTLELTKLVSDVIDAGRIDKKDLDALNKIRLLLDLPQIDESYFELYPEFGNTPDNTQNDTQKNIQE